VGRRNQHPSPGFGYRFSNRCADVFFKFAGEKAEVRLMAVLGGKLAKSG